MYSLARNGFTHDEVVNLLKSNRTITYRYELLDKTEAPIGTITATGSIDFNSAATVKRMATLSIKEMKDVDFLSDRVRPFMCLHTPSGKLDFPLGVFLLSSPSRTARNGIIEREIECYDKTQILVDDVFATRYYLAAGTNYIGAVLSILQSAGITNTALTPSDKETAVEMEFSIGESKLGAINKLLAAINYEDLYVDANGVFRTNPYMDPQTRTIEGFYCTDKRSIVLPGASENLDIFNAPNKIVRYLESAEREILISSATNDDPGSKLSTVSRGRTIVDVASVNDIADQTTLDALVQRVMAEKKIYQQISFETAAMPNHEYLDCLYIDNKDLDISGKYIEQSWKLNMVTGGTMSHIARRAVSV